MGDRRGKRSCDFSATEPNPTLGNRISPSHRLIMSLQDDDLQRHRQQILAQNGSTASSVSKRKGSPCSEDGYADSQAAKILGYSTPVLPEDIWRHIHSLMPLRDAARAACGSRAFLCSWRCLPNLIFNEDSLRLLLNQALKS